MEGYFSINDKISDIMGTMKGKLLMMEFSAKFMKEMKAQMPEGQMPDAQMIQSMSQYSIAELAEMAKERGVKADESMLDDLNAKLNKIKKA